MHRIDTPSAIAGLFTNGEPGIAPGPTVADDDWLNAVQEEIANTVESANASLIKGTNTQLLAAIRFYIKRQAEQTALGSFRTLTPASASHDFNAVAAGSGNNGVCAVGDGGAIEVGADTALATQSPAASYSGNFLGITYDASLDSYIAVGATGEIQSSSGGGSIWTRRKTGGEDLNAVATDGASTIVAVGNNGAIFYATPGGGSGTWTSATGTYGAANLLDVAYGAGVFVSVANNAGGIQHSSDGIAWTAHTFPGGGTVSRVSYSAGLGFVALSDTHIYLSVDGINWTQVAYVAPVSFSDIVALDTGLYWFHPGGGAVSDVRGVYAPYTTQNHVQKMVVPERINSAVWGPNRDIWVCGENGLVARSPRIAFTSA